MRKKGVSKLLVTFLVLLIIIIGVIIVFNVFMLIKESINNKKTTGLNSSINNSLESNLNKTKIIQSNKTNKSSQRTTTLGSGGGGGGNPTPCSPSKTCADYSGQCGVGLNDGCSNSLNCSTNCNSNQSCVNSICVNNCLPSNCTQLNKQCGNWDNGCGQQINCGGCNSGYNCSINGQCLQIGYNNNIKLMSKYSNKEAFLISDKNWKDVLPLVPLTTWIENETNCQKGYGTPSDVCVYPTLIWHEENPLNKNNITIDNNILHNFLFDINITPMDSYSYKMSVNKVDLNVNDNFTLTFNLSNPNTNPFILNSVNLNKFDNYFKLNSAGFINNINKQLNHRDTYSIQFNFTFIGANSSYDADSIIYFFQQYSPSKVTIIGQTPAELDNLLIAQQPLGAGLNSNQIQKITSNDYFSYWQNYSSLVYVEDNYELALLASSYASLINSPLVIKNISSDVANTYIGKRVICVGNVIPSGSSCNESYNLYSLQRKYINITNTDKIILVNPDDLNMSVIEEFQPDKSSGKINEIYGKTSLSAPILASAKKELLILKNSSNFSEIDSFMDNQLTNLTLANLTINYLTIVSSHIAIPEYTLEYGSKKTADWKYGSLNDVQHQIKTGRILGISISDASSYISRDLFYGYLFNKTYGLNNYSILSIANDRDDYMRDAEKVFNISINYGYQAKCFITMSSSVCSYGAPDFSEYRNKQIITFADHGWAQGWSGAISSDQLPNLDLPFTISQACSPSDIETGGGKTFGPTTIRKGAIANSGSIDVTASISGMCSLNQKATCLYDAHCKDIYELEPSIYGDIVAVDRYIDGTTGVGQIFIYNISSNSFRQITNDTNPKSNIQVGNLTVVWSNPNNINIYYLKNNETITLIGSNPYLYGNLLIYSKSGSSIYTYDILGKKENLILNYPNVLNPSIYYEYVLLNLYNGSLILYNMNTLTLNSLPINNVYGAIIYNGMIIYVSNYGLYSYNLSSQEIVKISLTDTVYSFPGIYENNLVYSEGNNNLDVFIYNLTNKNKIQLTNSTNYETTPKIYKNLIVYDYETLPYGGHDTYLYNLSSNNVRKIDFMDEDMGICLPKKLHPSLSVQYVLENQNVSLGELYNYLSNESDLNYMNDHLFLADPTLIPRWKE